MQYFFEMKNPLIQRITRHLLKKHQPAFMTYPAATKNHHDYASGLIDHVVSMLKLGKSLCELYPTLNKDLLYAGIILHDVGKVIELIRSSCNDVHNRRKFTWSYYDYGQ